MVIGSSKVGVTETVGLTWTKTERRWAALVYVRRKRDPGAIEASGVVPQNFHMKMS